MFHRGPDDFGEWWSDSGSVGMGHRRLSIIDLSVSAHQPMQRVLNKTVIVFNGEIYNFRELRKDLEQQGYFFESHSDTEVILAAYDLWGTDCLRHLNGMFAFAICDLQRGQLFLARDRAGEKPLFYHFANGTLRFASELKALLVDKSLSRQIDFEGFDYFLRMGFVPGARCILKGFNKLPPAHALTFDLQQGQLKTWRYWKVPKFSANSSIGDVDEVLLLEELESLLEDSVARQLNADVSVGILLSGGVDSSLVTALAVRSSSKIQTFTIGFPGQGVTDETAHARLIASHFGTRHHELMADSATADLLPLLAQQFDEPIIDSSMIPTCLVSQLVRQHCKVALGGDGADELFGGYSVYSRMLKLEQCVGIVPMFLRKTVAACSTNLLPIGFKGRNWLQALAVDFDNFGVPAISTYFDTTTRRKLMSKCNGWNASAHTVSKDFILKDPDLLQRATRKDFSNYLAEDILVKVDRASMLNSLEIRAPFLDYRVIEFAYKRVPAHLKATSNNRKILLKRLTERLLPPAFDRQRKQGFSIPLREWLKFGPFRKMFHDVLLDDSCLFNRDAVNSLLKGQDKGRNNAERLFSLTLFELWRRRYNVTA